MAFALQNQANFTINPIDQTVQKASQQSTAHSR
jgi:hypothetical protein